MPVCFAIIFRKDFLVIPRDFIDRFTTLLTKIGLEDRIIDNNFSNFTTDLFKPIDYDKVYENLNREIETSREMLIQALKVNETDTILSDIDVVMDYICSNSKQIEKLASNDEESTKLFNEILERIKNIEERMQKLELRGN